MPDSMGQLTIAEREAEIAELRNRIANAATPQDAARDREQLEFCVEALRRQKG